MRRRKISIPSTVLLIIMAIFIAFPFYIMLVGAFKPNINLIKFPVDLVPFKDLTLSNVIKVLTKSQIFLWLRNSFFISISVAILTAFVGLTAGYAFTRIKFRGRALFFGIVMATMMMPKQMLIIPNYLVAKNLALTDSLVGVILTTLAPAFGVFLSRQAISSLPSELFDAAEIDGCGEFRKFFTVVFPLSLPTVGTMSILSFFSTFNDYIWQLIMISDKKLMTLPIGISYFAEMQNNNRAVKLATALIATIPIAILFVACQKFFIKNATDGAIKG